MKLPIPKPKLLYSWGSTTSLALPYTKGEQNKTNTNLFKSITNNNALFCINNMTLKGTLGCVSCSHCSTSDLYNKRIHSCCFPCNYVTKP